jgi:type VI protein secretion system component Hcp
MAKGESSDLIMKFNDELGPIRAEGRTKLLTQNRSNQLIKGFEQDYMFEIDRFSFQAGITDDSNKNNKQQQQPKGQNTKNAKSLSTIATPGEFQAWRAGKNVQYPVDVHPVSFTRSIDAASSLLMQSCIDCTGYRRATVIKRKAAGGPAAGEIFLRIDFINVLVISVDWSNDDEVEETCHFICRSVSISYCPQLPDGTLGAIIPAFWSMVPNDTPPPFA